MISLKRHCEQFKRFSKQLVELNSYQINNELNKDPIILENDDFPCFQNLAKEFNFLIGKCE